jgi:hypothetical protein
VCKRQRQVRGARRAGRGLQRRPALPLRLVLRQRQVRGAGHDRGSGLRR